MRMRVLILLLVAFTIPIIAAPDQATEEEANTFTDLRANVAAACPAIWEDLSAEINTSKIEGDIWQEDQSDKGAFIDSLIEQMGSEAPGVDTLNSMADDEASVATECASHRVILLDALISKTPRDLLLAMDAVNRGLNKTIEYLDGGWSVGDVRVTGRSKPQDGWVFLTGKTIGNASSGADLTGDNFNELYELAKNWAPNSGDEQWDTGNLVTLPDMRGRALIAANNMGGAAADVLSEQTANQVGGMLGEERRVLTVDELPAHTHTGSLGGQHSHSTGSAGTHAHKVLVSRDPKGNIGGDTYASIGTNDWRSGRINNAGNHGHTISTEEGHLHSINETGGGNASSVMQPSIVFNVEMKY